MIMKCHDIGLETSINTKMITELSIMVADMMNMPVQANKAIVGKNAFAHSSGIHQDGFLKNRENYEIINPSDVGADSSSIILTARSGRAALSHKLSAIGYDVSKTHLDELYKLFLELADSKKDINEDDLRGLLKRVNLLKD